MNQDNRLYEQGIDLLLEKYYAGTSSTEEELRLYLLLADVGADSRYFVDAEMLRQQFVPYDTEMIEKKSKRRLYLISLGSLVASILLMLGLSVCLQRETTTQDDAPSALIILPDIEVYPEGEANKNARNPQTVQTIIYPQGETEYVVLYEQSKISTIQ